MAMTLKLLHGAAFLFLCLTILHFGNGEISCRTSSNFASVSSLTSLAADLALTEKFAAWPPTPLGDSTQISPVDSAVRVGLSASTQTSPADLAVVFSV